jgi:hypothetical protein
MKKITKILILIFLASCTSEIMYNRNNIKNGLYYGTNAGFDPTPPHIFVEIDNDTAFFQSLFYIKGESELVFEKTLYKLKNNDTIYKGDKSIIFIEDNILFFEYTKGSIWIDTNTQNNKSYILNSQEKGYRTKIKYDSTNIEKYLALKKHVHKPFKHFKIVKTYINK